MSECASLSARINTIKSEMARKQFEGLRTLLEGSLGADQIQTIREQKLLFRVPIELQKQFLSLFSDAARRTLSDEQATYAGAYAAFVEQASRIEKTLSGLFSSKISQLKTYCFADLLFELDTWLQQSYAHISEQIWSGKEPVLRAAQPSALELSSLSEQTLQTQVGYINEIVFAAARLLNDAAGILHSKGQRGLGNRKREALIEALPGLVIAAHQWNCTLYAIDKVTYGEWQVKNINSDSCTFELVDARLEFSRIVGLRREVVQQMQKLRTGSQSTLHIEKQLLGILPHFLEASLEYFSQKCGLVVSLVSYWELRHRLEKRLGDLQSHDDLLLLAAGQQGRQVFHDYLACAAVRWLKEICDHAKCGVPKSRQRLGETSHVSLSTLLSFLPLDDENRDGVRSAIGTLCRFPPRGSFYSLLDHPCMLFDDDSIAFVTALDAGHWSASIRSKWARDGGLGSRYGRVWEDYICWLVTERGWTILNRNVTLRQHRRPVTDVDLLVSRDNVCLIVQLKALAGAGANTYEHWKNRQTIEKGISQARIAADLLGSSADLLASIVGGRAVRLIESFRPVVLTTLHYFNGWHKDGVSVLSVDALQNLMRGATVQFWNLKGDALGKVEHSGGSQVTGAELLDFLDRPVDWRISAGDEAVTKHSFQIEGTTWTYPLVASEVLGLELHPDR